MSRDKVVKKLNGSFNMLFYYATAMKCGGAYSLLLSVFLFSIHLSVTLCSTVLISESPPAVCDAGI